jgi:putative DNA primase/helicase
VIAGALGAALRYAGLGLKVMVAHGKRPILDDWPNKATTDPTTITAWWRDHPGANVGIVPDETFAVLDIDTHKGGDKTIAALEARHGPLPETIVSRTGGGGTHAYYRVQLGRPLQYQPGPGVEILNSRRQAIEAPSIHPDTGQAYEWITPPWAGEMADAPEWFYKPEQNAKDTANGHAPAGETERRYARAALDGERQRLALQQQPGRNIALNNAALALGSLAHVGAYTEGEAHAALRAACELNGLIADDGMSAFEATFSSGWSAGLREPRDVPKREASQEQDARPPQFSDDALALRFTAQFGNQARFVAAWAKWLFYDGARWRPDDTLRAFSEARIICRDAAAECHHKRDAAKIKSKATIAAVERMACADRRHAATTDDWDRDPWLLNTPGGTVDLRTGALGQHRGEDMITKWTAVAPAAECPGWIAFLDRIFDRDAELIGFVRRALGYALTGETREHALFFGYGSGGNGKGVLINSVTGVMGDYATVAPMETFTATLGERHPTDLAMLRAARLVTAQETEQGKHWSETRIKALTGGDPITARFMRQDFFTFVPAFKLFIAGNHKPSLRGVDEAIRRRLHLIPFAVTIPAAERDPKLQEKLKTEWPGILAWMIDGCVEWQHVGLAPPAAVTAATADYLAEEDTFGSWLGECVREAYEGATETTADLFASWKRYAEAAGEQVGSQKAFSHAMQARGFKSGKFGHDRTRGFRGIRLVRPTAEPRDDG